MTHVSRLNDRTWFRLIADPEAARARGVTVPGLPEAAVQTRFNGKAGKPNLKQAFEFYRFVRDEADCRNARIMDFGAGWGRHARFFLRDTAPERILAVDPDPDAHAVMQACGLPVQLYRSQPQPPLADLTPGSFDVIYAHSVFSHLAEALAVRWLRHLDALLAPGGTLIFTTRGRAHLDHVRRTGDPRGVFGDCDALARRLDAGEFVFCRDRPDSAKLSGRWFGEAFIPRAYVEALFGRARVRFTEEVPLIPQAVAVVRKPDADRPAA
jgi:SAM-dependent methyltransferase